METERDKNEFNMAVSYLGRLNALLYAADESSMQLDSFGWYHSLRAIYRELATEMTEKEIEKFNKDFDKLGEGINQIITQQQRTGVNSIPPILYNQLHTIEIGLRKILKDAGLQGKTMDNAGAALK